MRPTPAQQRIYDLKMEMRAYARTRLKGTNKIARVSAAEGFLQQFMAYWKAHQGEKKPLIAGYWPLQWELDCRLLLMELLEKKFRICLPVVVAKGAPLIFREYKRDDAMTRHPKFGMYEPREDKPVLNPDVVIVPLLAFDKNGYRLGSGLGFYDRTLAKLRHEKKVLTIGAAYASQQVDAVPTEAHDQPLDVVITENKIQISEQKERL